VFYVRKPRRVNKVARVRLNLVVVGERAVGKSSLVRRYVHDRFGRDYVQTSGTRVHHRKLAFTLPDRKLDVRADLIIWDVMGDASATGLLRQAHFFAAHGIVAVCDASRGDTLQALNGWLEGAYAVNPRASVQVVANKWDDRSRVLNYDDLEHHARARGIPHLPASARTGANVEGAFREVVERALRHHLDLLGQGAGLSIGTGGPGSPAGGPVLPPREPPAGRGSGPQGG
jgi:small GTP-binding protein